MGVIILEESKQEAIMMKQVFIFMIVACLSYKGEAIQCYSCTSVLSPGSCTESDPGTSKMDCPGNMGCFISVATADGTSVVARGCGATSLFSCVNEDMGNGISGEVCTCNEALCNKDMATAGKGSGNAGNTIKFTSATILTSLFSLLLGKFLMA